MKNPPIEYAVLGGFRRFSESERLLLQIDLDHADRFAKLLKRFLALPRGNLRTVAELAGGLATSELGLSANQVIGEILPNEHQGTRGFARPYPNDHRIFIRLHDDPCQCVVASVVFHEIKHREQVISGKFMTMLGRGESEPDAEEFARRIMRKHHFICGDCGKTY
jgi:hypothetical protein